MKNGKIGVIIPAAGRGTRMNHYFPKQFLLKGHPIIYYTLSVFQEHEAIAEIIVAVEEDLHSYMEENVIKRGSFDKVKEIVAGGKSRQESVYHALVKGKGWDWVIIHDAVRPFLSQSILAKTIETVQEREAVAVGIPLHDTLKKVAGQATIVKTLPRDNLWMIQTPQAFSYSLISEAHEKARREGFEGTDDASLVERMGKEISLVMGSPLNIKITTPEDLLLAQAIMEIGDW
ncbi:MAG: 2-C-methyl-D-erythritol 4-phosphate cytidylyltransferase [Caldiserica bacterium]|nr:2-C-methyl-D-erythritol 4-phosphate cytidylyltransferase [Caldisericota bacterium]